MKSNTPTSVFCMVITSSIFLQCPLLLVFSVVVDHGIKLCIQEHFFFPILDYQFKEDCNTQKKIASKLKSFAERSLLQDEDKIRRELFDLIQVAFLSKSFTLLILD